MKKPSQTIIISALALTLCACGSKRDLRAVDGQRSPAIAYGNQEPAEPKELLEGSTQAMPERSIELRSRSEEREEDPFDLPPE